VLVTVGRNVPLLPAAIAGHFTMLVLGKASSGGLSGFTLLGMLTLMLLLLILIILGVNTMVR
jgi:hypothetical protein